MSGWLRITIDLFIGRVGNRPNEFKDNYRKASKRRSAMARRIPIVSRDELSAEHQTRLRVSGAVHRSVGLLRC